MTKISLTVRSVLAAAASIALIGCSGQSAATVSNAAAEKEEAVSQLEYRVYPETMELELQNGSNAPVTVSYAGPQRDVEAFQNDDTSTSWKYPGENIQVRIQNYGTYLEVSLESLTEEDNSFEWPLVAAEIYDIPFGEGKRIPADDAVWQDYLEGQEYEVIEQLSMPFMAAESGDQAVLYIMEQPHRSQVRFQSQQDSSSLSFTMNHDYPEIDSERDRRFRIYLTEADAASIAKTYRSYVIGQGNFVTLEEKAERNPNVRKLYGAPHIYFWGDRLLAEEDIKWKQFASQLESPAMAGISRLLEETSEGQEMNQVLTAMGGQDYVDQYQKKIIIRELSALLRRKDFYKAFGQDGKAASALNPVELIQYNKSLLAEGMPGVFAPLEQWAAGITTDVLKDMKDSGIENAWIGFNNWEDAYGKPEMVALAEEQGYLSGPYDSYHSVHEPGKEQWNTASFPDRSLYESASVSDRNGKKIAGFQNVGRKLNPTLSMPSVEERVTGILDTGLPFNSWFIDCDGTGEIYDDYSPAHKTTRQQDLQARIARMEYLSKEQNMVVGTEGGNDFAAKTAAFAHGLELQSFSWMDEDMKANRDSEYYLGRYYSADGGVPEKFGKPVPIKEKYRSIFLDMKYQVPLYKLVYQDSIITAYHWDWSTLKIAGEEDSRMLREILYQVPPLYHLDRALWEEQKEGIVSHVTEWSRLNREIAGMPMTDFKRISEDGLIQLTEFGSEWTMIANFSENEYQYYGKKIPAGGYIAEQKEGAVSAK